MGTRPSSCLPKCRTRLRTIQGEITNAALVARAFGLTGCEQHGFGSHHPTRAKAKGGSRWTCAIFAAGGFVAEGPAHKPALAVGAPEQPAPVVTTSSAEAAWCSCQPCRSCWPSPPQCFGNVGGLCSPRHPAPNAAALVHALHTLQQLAALKKHSFVPEAQLLITLAAWAWRISSVCSATGAHRRTARPRCQRNFRPACRPDPPTT